MKKNTVLLVIGALLMAGVPAAQAKSGALESTKSVATVTMTAMGPIGTITATYCSDKTSFTRAKDVREYFRLFSKCIFGTIRNSGHITVEGLKWTGKGLKALPGATQGTSEGTTDGLSGEEQEALIELAQEDLMAVAGGGEASAFAEVLLETKREFLARDAGPDFAAMADDQLAPMLIRDLDELRAEF